MSWRPSPDSFAGLLVETARRLVVHRVVEMSAALAFYCALSLAPVLIITLGVAGLLVDRSVLQEHVVTEADRVLGHGTGDLMRRLGAEQHAGGTGTLATVSGGILLLVGAMGVFGQLQDGLDRIWEVQPPRRRGLWLFLRKRLVSVAMVASLGFLLLVSLLVSAVLSALADHMALTAGQNLAANVAHLLASMLVATLLFALVFRLLPDTKVAWAEAWGGGALTSVLFHAGEWAIGQYLGRASVGSTYGAAGTLVVLLVWVYYSSVIVFAGAEFTRVHAMRRKGGGGQAEASLPPAD
jgi:membrane protein